MVLITICDHPALGKCFVLTEVAGRRIAWGLAKRQSCALKTNVNSASPVSPIAHPQSRGRVVLLYGKDFQVAAAADDVRPGCGPPEILSLESLHVESMLVEALVPGALDRWRFGFASVLGQFPLLLFQVREGGVPSPDGASPPTNNEGTLPCRAPGWGGALLVGSRPQD